MSYDSGGIIGNFVALTFNGEFPEMACESRVDFILANCRISSNVRLSHRVES